MQRTYDLLQKQSTNLVLLKIAIEIMHDDLQHQEPVGKNNEDPVEHAGGEDTVRPSVASDAGSCDQVCPKDPFDGAHTEDATARLRSSTPPKESESVHSALPVEAGEYRSQESTPRGQRCVEGNPLPKSAFQN